MTAEATNSVDFIPDFDSKFVPKDDLLSRFQIHQGCPNLPGHCSVCGSSTGLMFDFGIEIEFYGHIYLCVGNCFREAANRVGYFSTDQVGQIQHAHDELVKAQEELIAENRNLNNALDSLARVRVDRFDAGVDQLLMDASTQEHSSEDNGTGGEESDKTAGDEQSSPPESAESAKKPVPRKARSTKQNDGKGSTSFSGDDSLAILESDGTPDI